MPRYEYACSHCEETFSVVHGMTERIDQCSLCESEGTVNILPSIIQTSHTKATKKAGELVKQYIKDTKEYVKQQKEDLIRNYKDDN